MLEVTATCGWCSVKVKTTLENPVPEGWDTRSVKSPDFANDGNIALAELFCKKPCGDKYVEEAKGCHAASADAYRTTFYAQMNDARKRVG